MKRALSRNGFEVTVLKSARVTREDIATALEKLFEASGRDDRLLVYFSTHGFADSGNAAEGYLATSDCRMRSPTARCFRLGDLETHSNREINGENVKQVLFAVDSCFSGLGIARKSASSSMVDLSRLAGAQGVFMLTAGMADQFAQIDPRLGMSTFTYYLAEGLNGSADLVGNGGLITLTQLYVYVQYKVAAATRAKQIPMMGLMRGSGEMLFRPARQQR